MKSSVGIVAVAVLGALATLTGASAAERTTLPGRQVKVAAIAVGYGVDHEQKLKLAIEHLEPAGIDDGRLHLVDCRRGCNDRGRIFLGPLRRARVDGV
jgi:hypothetical protein